MIINDEHYGEFNICLEDDGTLDTVISVHHSIHGRKGIRYSTEYGANFRDADGAMNDEGFEILAKESVEAYIDLYLLDDCPCNNCNNDNCSGCENGQED